MALSLHKFLWGANRGGIESQGPADRFNPVPQGGIGNVSAIPGNKVVHTVDRRNRDVQGIHVRVLGKGNPFDEIVGEAFRFLGHVQFGDPGKDVEPLLGRFRIAGGALLSNGLGNVRIELRQVLGPPIVGELLIRSRQQVAAWADVT